MLKNSSYALSMKCIALVCIHVVCSQWAAALEIGDQLCIQGFIMDYFCIENGNMIDNGRVTLEEPDRHTVHCLVDVGICVETAFEVLVESPQAFTSYSRGYRLDDSSKTDIIRLARSVGSCDSCVNGYDNSMLSRGFKAVMKVTVLDLNPDYSQKAPPLVQVNDRKDASGLGNDPCQSEYGMMEGVPIAAPTNRPTQPPTPSTSSPTPGPTPDPTPEPTPPPALTRIPTPTPSTELAPSPTMPPIVTLLPTPGPTSRPTREPTPLPTKVPTTSPPSKPPSTPHTSVHAPTSTDTTSVATPTPSPNVASFGGEEDLADSGTGITLFWTTTIAAFSSLYVLMIL